MSDKNKKPKVVNIKEFKEKKEREKILTAIMARAAKLDW